MFTREEAAVTSDLQNPTSSLVSVTIPKEFIRHVQQNVTFDPPVEEIFLRLKSATFKIDLVHR